jgi:CspA family cold shock protein
MRSKLTRRGVLLGLLGLAGMVPAMASEPESGLAKLWKGWCSLFSRSAAVPASAEVGAARDYHGLEVTRLTGIIKWFDAVKGYGFITPDDGRPEILLHVTCLRACGYQTAFAGARVDCQVLRRPKGHQAFRILSMDDSTALTSQTYRRHVQVRAESDWEYATVKWFNRVRGFGFLTCGEDKLQIFVHLETVRRSGLVELRPGQIVQVRWGMGSKGCMAAELRPLPQGLAFSI